MFDKLTIALVSAAIGAFCYGWYMQTDPIVAEPTKDLLGTPTVSIPCESIKTHEPSKKKKTMLGLSKEIQKDDTLHLVATTSVPERDVATVVTALYDSEGKAIRLLQAPQPSPMLQFRGGKFISAHYGVKDEEGSTWRIGVGMEFLRVKALRIGAVGQFDTVDGGYFVGAGLAWPF